MHLHFGGGTGVDAAAELSGLPIATAWTLALRGLGQTYREIGALESALGRSMANAHWLRFLDAIETGQCALRVSALFLERAGTSHRDC